MKNKTIIQNINTSIINAFPTCDTVIENDITYANLSGFFNNNEIFELSFNNESSSITITTEKFKEITSFSIEEYHQISDSL